MCVIKEKQLLTKHELKHKGHENTRNLKLFTVALKIVEWIHTTNPNNACYLLYCFCVWVYSTFQKTQKASLHPFKEESENVNNLEE